MVERSIHLVGSIPCSSAEDGMRLALSKNGQYLHTLSDGEAGGEWIIPIIRSLRENPSISVRTEGNWSSYKDVLILRVRRGAKFKADSLDFGRVALFEEHYPLFQKLREEYQRPDLAYQVSIAGDLDVAMLSMGIQGALFYRSVFAEETVREIRAIQEKGHGDVVFQLELPIELVLVTKMPGFLQAAVSKFLARKVLRLVEEAPAGTRFGIHLCLGDFHNQALGRLKTTAPLVQFANALTSQWPTGRKLEFVHVPLAAGKTPPPLRETFYRDLRKLKIPAGTRFIAGLVHEKSTLDEQQQVLEWVEQAIGYPVDVAAACGLGRRDRQIAETLLDRSKELVEGQAVLSPSR